MGLMIKYNGTDVRRINHALKVFAFAQFLAAKENCGERSFAVISYAALLHDIGIHEAERKYNTTAGKYQEAEGPAVAEELLRGIPIPPDMTERVLFLIGHHHSYGKIDGLDFQILVEADFLVNIDEDSLPEAEIISIQKKIFKTESGIALISALYRR